MILTALVTIACGAAVWWFVAAGLSRRLEWENFVRIRNGMTQAEVERLLGGPPGNYGRFSSRDGVMTLEGYQNPPGSVERVWCNDDLRYEIYFDATGKVVGFHKRSGYSQKPMFQRRSGWMDWLRLWPE